MLNEVNLTESNNSPIIVDTLIEDKITRLIDKHSKNGFANISAFRSNRYNNGEPLSIEETRKINIQKTGELKNDLKNLGWSYTVSYGGGFKEKEDTKSPSKYKFNEISFIVYNYNRKNKNANLLDDMKKLTAKYEQDDFYYQEPNGKAHWYDKNGKEDASFSKMVKNDDKQPYFTGISSSKLSKKTVQKYMKNGKVGSDKAFEHRYSGVMEGVNPPPLSYAEEAVRAANGEIFLSTYNVLTEEDVYQILGAKKFFNY